MLLLERQCGRDYGGATMFSERRQVLEEEGLVQGSSLRGLVLDLMQEASDERAVISSEAAGDGSTQEGPREIPTSGSGAQPSP